MTAETLFKFLKLLAYYYFKFFIGIAIVLAITAGSIYLLAGEFIFDSFEKVASILFLVPLLVTIMQIGFDAWEGKLKDNLHDR